MPDAGQQAGHRIIFPVRNWIELVRMTPCATQGQAQKGGARRAHHVIQFVSPLLRRQHRIRTTHDINRPADQKTSGHIDAERVAGQLLADELVIRFVLIECGNDVIAESPCVRTFPVCFKSVALGESDHIEPMAPPAFSIPRVIEHTIHQPFKCPGLGIRQEMLDLLRRRWHAQHHQIKAANERPAIGLVRKFEPLAGQLCLDEGIDGICTSRAAGTSCF